MKRGPKFVATFGGEPIEVKRVTWHVWDGAKWIIPSEGLAE